MCLLALAWKRHPAVRLLAAANRDEFHARPTRAAQFWPDMPDLLAGRDEQAGGTWLGLSRLGRFAAVTNVREPGGSPGTRSRGHLVSTFLDGQQPAMAFLESAAASADAYSGFNLLVCDGQTMGYFSNRNGGSPRALEPGVYALSNHALDTPWPKLLRLRDRFAETIEQETVSEEALFRLLADKEPADPDSLPDTGLPFELEHRLSAPFVVSPEYGTRCSTLVSLWEDGQLELRERRFSPQGNPSGESHFRMTWERQD